MCDIRGDIGKRDVSERDDRSRSIRDGASETGLIDGLRSHRRQRQQHWKRNGPSRHCEFEYPHHTLQSDPNATWFRFAAFGCYFLRIVAFCISSMLPCQGDFAGAQQARRVSSSLNGVLLSGIFSNQKT
jgi:hypothetical protein